MREALIAAIACVFAASGAHGQEFVKPLTISSLGDRFSVVGRFVGRATVYDDSIAVEFDTLSATRVHHGGPVQVTRLDSMRVAIGQSSERAWSPVDASQSLQVERVMTVGSRIELPPTRFVLPHRRNARDADAWLVVIFHLTVGTPGEKDFHPDATTYAHSAKGILSPPKKCVPDPLLTN
jgi:hypothetical protein